MKKILIGLVLSIAFLLAAVYLFIPRQMKIEAAVSMNIALPGVIRTLENESNWKKWWPGKTHFTYNGQSYFISGNIFNVFNIDIYTGKDTIQTRMEFVFVDANAMTILWNAHQANSNNPFKRIIQYSRANKTEKNMNVILKSLEAFLNKKENIYGFNIS